MSGTLPSTQSRFSLDAEAPTHLKGTKKSLLGIMRGTITPPVSRSRAKELDLFAVNQKVTQQTAARQPPTSTRDSSAKMRSRENPPPQKSRSILNRFASKIRLPALPAVSTGGGFANAGSAAYSVSAKEMRDQALRERGLLPPLSRLDLSQQEHQRDLMLHVDIEPKSSSEDEPSAASVIKREWEAKNSTTMQTFRFGGNASTHSLPLFPAEKEQKEPARADSPELLRSVPLAPTRAVPDTPAAALHVQAPSIADEEQFWDPYSIPLPPSPCPTSNDSMRTLSMKSPSIKSTKSISKSLRSLAKSIKSTRSRKLAEVNDMPSSPVLLFPLNFSPPSPAHSFPSPLKQAFSFTAESTEDKPVITEEPAVSATASEFDIAPEFFTPPTSPTQILTPPTSPAAISPHVVLLPPSPHVIPLPLSPVESEPSENVLAPRGARPLVQSITPSISTRSRSRSTVASSMPLPSLSETASVVSDNDSEAECRYPLPKQYEPTPLRNNASENTRAKPRDAAARLTGLNINISSANAGMIPVIVESPVEESWWPVIVNSSLETDFDLVPKTDVGPIVDKAPTDLTSLVITEEPENDAVPVLEVSNVAAEEITNKADSAKPNRRKSMAAFSSSFSSLRRSVVGTLSSKQTISSTRSAPNVRTTSLLKSPTYGGFDASHLPPSPTTPTSMTRSATQSAFNSRTVGTGPRRGIAPTMHSRGSILVETNEIEDEESRRMTEMAFLY